MKWFPEDLYEKNEQKFKADDDRASLVAISITLAILCGMLIFLLIGSLKSIKIDSETLVITVNSEMKGR